MRIRETWKADQSRWAAEHGYSPDEKGYVKDLNFNLFQPMSQATKKDFDNGSGSEIHPRRRGDQPKMHALHSSSALACNVFDYWRSKGVGPVGAALGIELRTDNGLAFEKQY